MRPLGSATGYHFDLRTKFYDKSSTQNYERIEMRTHVYKVLNGIYYDKKVPVQSLSDCYNSPKVLMLFV